MTSVASHNITFVAHSDQAGRSDGVQVMVDHGYAYIGQTFSNGITILDVRDPKHPRFVDFLPCPPNTRTIHLQTHEDLLVATNMPRVWRMQEFQDQQKYFAGSPADLLKAHAGSFTTGIRVFDIAKPEKPREIGFLPVDGIGPHRLWYTGGRYAYASIHFADFTDTSSPSSTCPIRRSLRSSGAGGLPVCGAAAPRRRPGLRASATRCTTRSWPETWPSPPGVTAGSPSSPTVTGAL